VSRRRLVVTALVLLALLAPAVAVAQAPPLAATLTLVNPPPDVTYSPTTPIKITLALTNVSGAPIITTAGFSSTEFWRNLYFQLYGVGTITDATASQVHSFIPFGTCHYRNNVLLPGAGIQVTPVEVLPGNYGVQFVFDDARAHFDLTRPGRYTANARITFFVYDSGAIITDCNIEFGGQSLLSIGANVTPGRRQFSIVSNSLEFVIPPSDTTPPTTTVVQSPAPNAAGWNNQNVTLTFTATDNPNGSGVNRIEVSLAGAQAGAQTLPGTGGAVTVTAQGTTTVTYVAVDNLDNIEDPQSLTVKIDKTAPVVTPPAAISVAATEAGGARGSASPALAAFLAAGSATDNLDPAPVRLSAQVGGVDVTNSTLFPIGTTTVTFRFRDQAGNIGSATANVTVVAGPPAISVAIAGSGVRSGRVLFYDLRFTNTGTSVAKAVSLQQMTFATLSGRGNVSYNTQYSPPLPVALGDVAAGASITLRVYLTVPVAVRTFSMTESGQFKNSAGTTLSYSSTQTVTP